MLTASNQLKGGHTMLKYKSQKGFTIVELLIVIVVIGILAALVLNTFAGVQKRARDTERQTDVTAIATQLEKAYTDNGGYPLFTQIDTEAEATAFFKGIDAGALSAPGKPFSLGSNASADKDSYGYQATGCTADDNSCTAFTLTYTKEELKTGETNPVSKASLNN